MGYTVVLSFPLYTLDRKRCMSPKQNMCNYFYFIIKIYCKFFSRNLTLIVEFLTLIVAFLRKMSVCVCARVHVHMQAYIHVNTSGDSLVELSLSFRLYVGSRG